MEETEFNLFPSSRATHHLHHKRRCNMIDALRLSAVYGANGAGKSNFIKAIVDLRTIVLMGGVVGVDFQPYKFQLRKRTQNEPISMAIELYQNGNVYYYSVEFDNNIVSYESLSLVGKDSDTIIFERKTNGVQSISFGEGYENNKKNKFFANVIQDKLLNKGALLLSFMANNYADEIAGIKEVYYWFVNKLIVINPSSLLGTTAHFLDTNKGMMEMANKLLPEMKTGISGISINCTELDEKRLGDNWIPAIKEMKTNPGRAIPVPNNMDGRIEASVVYENGKIMLKELQPIHKLEDGSEVRFPITFESDGTIRLINYMPLLYFILKVDTLVLIDEIERSLHPILIKEIIRKISETQDVMGQLIFTTHESCLLDQEIFRPDEIWFAEKDSFGASHMYPLSDFNIHKTANIKNGYLEGRYGGIPFLSNIKDLNWWNDIQA